MKKYIKVLLISSLPILCFQKATGFTIHAILGIVFLLLTLLHCITSLHLDGKFTPKLKKRLFIDAITLLSAILLVLTGFLMMIYGITPNTLQLHKFLVLLLVLLIAFHIKQHVVSKKIATCRKNLDRI